MSPNKASACLQVFGKRAKDLSADERLRFARVKRQASHYRRYAVNTGRVREQQRAKKLAVIKAIGLEPKCQTCGYARYIGALEFHHLDPASKDHGILDRGFDAAVIEARKCVLVCSNCHREAHDAAGLRGTGRPREYDPLLVPYLYAIGLSEAEISVILA